MNIGLDLRPRGVGELLDWSIWLYRRSVVVATTLSMIVIGAQVACNAMMFATLGDTRVVGVVLLMHAVFGNMPVMAMIVAWMSLWAGVPSPALAEAPGDSLSTFAGSSGINETMLLVWLTLVVILGLFVPLIEATLVHHYVERALGRPTSWKVSLLVGLHRWRAVWLSGLLRLLPNALGEITFLIGVVSVVSTVVFVFHSGGSTLDFTPVVGSLLVLAVGVGLAWTSSQCAASVPTIVSEGAGALRSVGRSLRLSAPHAGQVAVRLMSFWLARIVTVALPLVLIALVLPGSMMPSGRFLGLSDVLIQIAVVALLIVSCVIAFPLNCAFVAANYVDLRIRTDPYDLEL